MKTHVQKQNQIAVSDGNDLKPKPLNGGFSQNRGHETVSGAWKGQDHHFNGLRVNPPVIQAKLSVNQPNDIYEQEADATAEKVMRMENGTAHQTSNQPINIVQRKCAGCGDEEIQKSEDEDEDDVQRMPIQRKCAECEKEEEKLQRKVIQRKCDHCEEEEKGLQRKQSDQSAPNATAAVHQTLQSSGKPLDKSTRSFMESRFGYDFGKVRIHDNTLAHQSARDIKAVAYTHQNQIVFGQGQYQPQKEMGRKLLAHELAHIVQQNDMTHSTPIVQRQEATFTQSDSIDAEMERKYANSGAPKAKTCGRPSHCPPGFCDPYSSQKLAEYYRAKNGPILMTGISAVVDSKVVPLWQEYLAGGSSTKNLTAGFSKDFTQSPTTHKATGFLMKALKDKLTASPPPTNVGKPVTVDIKSLIPGEIATLDDETSVDRMNFSAPRDIPGNMAGDIGKNQVACQSGAQPSSFDDKRIADGKVELFKDASGAISVIPNINFTVKDTIDLCPGDCGAPLEQIATVPFSQFEATGISGDVPFTVDFPAPAAALLPFVIGPPKPAPVVPVKPAGAPPATVPKPDAH